MDYKSVIESRYNRESWEALLHDIFLSGANFRTTPIPVDAHSPLVDESLQLGTITLKDDNKIAVYEIKLSDRVDIVENRVGIRNLLFSDWKLKGCAGAFIFCYRENESVLRFSYVSQTFAFGEDGKMEKEETDTKRFTYILGEGHRSRTAIGQFEALKTSSQTLKDLTKAFSLDAVSDKFFDDYKKVYEDIVEYVTGKRYEKDGSKWVEKVIHAPNERLMAEFSWYEDPDKTVRDYVKKLMSRIVFLQFIQKKGWLGVPIDKDWGDGDKEFLQHLYEKYENKDNFIDGILELLFDDINHKRENDLANFLLGRDIKVPYLNGGLFERDSVDERTFRLPRSLMDDMMDFFSSYNFTIDENDPDDAEIGVDPEMLGRIFENLLEDNKDKGAFYTPKEIVQYMCQESLIAYLQKGKSEVEAESIRTFVSTYDASVLGEALKQEVDLKLKNVKICDPAIGSGAFPMGLLKELFECRSAIEGLSEDNAAEIKKHIIQNNIYGVDIEKGAVEIARLRFWLAIIVDEKTPHTLPNMDFKIMQGNSLIPTFNGKVINLYDKTRHINSSRILACKSRLFELQKVFYNSESEHKKELLVQIKHLILEIVKLQMDYEQKVEYQNKAYTLDLFNPNTGEVKVDEGKTDIIDTCISLQSVLENKNTPITERANLQLPFFDWMIMFPEVFGGQNNTKGFDIVIGNPPYIKEDFNRQAFDGFRELSPYYMGKMDLWYGFACHGINMLSSDGHLCFIAQNNWTTSSGAKILRNHVIEKTKILQLLDFNDYMVFGESASIQTMIMLFSNDTISDNYQFDHRVLLHGAQKKDMVDLLYNRANPLCSYRKPSIIRESYKNSFLTFSPQDDLLNRIAAGKVYLTEDEATNGIHPHYDFVNNKINRNHPEFPVGTGIFGLSESEKESLSLSDNEKALIKPYFTSEQVHRFYTSPKNTLWIIYTTSDYKNPHSMDSYPHLKQHLDRFQDVISSCNKPYGLHRSRKEEFFNGEKIVALRKCVGRPLFSYSDFDCYVSATFYVIKTERWDMKFLTGILNSQLIKFWLKNKGKMQGENYQLDKEPLEMIPLPNPSVSQKEISDLVGQIVECKMRDPSFDSTALERHIDKLVYEIYGLSKDDITIVESV